MMTVSEYLNTVKTCGMKAARARHNRDESLAGFMKQHASKVFAMFKGGDRTVLELAFQEAYREEADSYGDRYRA